MSLISWSFILSLSIWSLMGGKFQSNPQSLSPALLTKEKAISNRWITTGEKISRRCLSFHLNFEKGSFFSFLLWDRRRCLFQELIKNEDHIFYRRGSAKATSHQHCDIQTFGIKNIIPWKTKKQSPMTQLHGISGIALASHSCVGNITLLRRKTGNTVLLGYHREGTEKRRIKKQNTTLDYFFVVWILQGPWHIFFHAAFKGCSLH